MFRSEITEFDTTHGSPWDRGGADSYYGRPRDPHWGGVGGPRGYRRETDLTQSEIQAYHAGYDWNELYGERKDWS
jgi:hypothetical protein